MAPHEEVFNSNSIDLMEYYGRETSPKTVSPAPNAKEFEQMRRACIQTERGGATDARTRDDPVRPDLGPR